MRAPILLSALGALALSMPPASAQQPDEAAPDEVENAGRIAVDPDVWTTAGARVPALELPVIVGDLGRAQVSTDGGLDALRPGARDLYSVLRTTDDDRPDGALPKRTLLIQFASW